MHRAVLALLALASVVRAAGPAAPPAVAAEVETLLLSEGPGPPAEEQRAPLPEPLAGERVATLEPLAQGAADGLKALVAWNTAGGVPVRNGIPRPLPLARQVRLDGALAARLVAGAGAVRHAGGTARRLASGSVVWSGAVEVEGAWRLRLHLAGAQLPPGTRLSVAGGDEVVSFRAEGVPGDGALWTPSVPGPVARLEVELPAEGGRAAAFVLERALELVPLDARGVPHSVGTAPLPTPEAAASGAACLVDPACAAAGVPASLAALRRATARLDFVLARDGFSYLCTGGLLNDTDEETTTPYLLTAHHCIPDEATAATVEAVFDYAATSCGGAPPSLASLPRVAGARLLATTASADASLLLLPELPAGRALLGWTSERLEGEVHLHRISHPSGLPQGYSRGTATPAGTSCGSMPRDRFLYSRRVSGGIFQGSSGAPAVRESDGKVVGQAGALCGPASVLGDGCSDANFVVDGRLSEAWPLFQPWLAPFSETTPCVPDGTTLCLGAGDRFAVRARFAAGPLAGEARTVELTVDTGYLWFFDAANVEAVVKVLDGCGVNGRVWVFAGGLTDVQVTLTVTDTASGATRTYANPAGRPFEPVQDTAAFACE